MKGWLQKITEKKRANEQRREMEEKEEAKSEEGERRTNLLKRGREEKRKNQMRRTNGGTPTGVGLAKTAVLSPIKESFNQFYKLKLIINL